MSFWTVQPSLHNLPFIQPHFCTTPILITPLLLDTTVIQHPPPFCITPLCTTFNLTTTPFYNPQLLNYKTPFSQHPLCTSPLFTYPLFSTFLLYTPSCISPRFTNTKYPKPPPAWIVVFYPPWLGISYGITPPLFLTARTAGGGVGQLGAVDIRPKNQGAGRTQ